MLTSASPRNGGERNGHPDCGLAREELVDLARWLLPQRARARDLVRERRRIRRGKADPRGATPETPSERGLSAKKRVFARALGRVNNRIERLRAGAVQARNAARLRDAQAGRDA
jgi:hypothetical protein